MSTISKFVATVCARPFGFVAISCYPKVVMMHGSIFGNNMMALMLVQHYAYALRWHMA
jgi:hypothetical protein